MYYLSRNYCFILLIFNILVSKAIIVEKLEGNKPLFDYEFNTYIMTDKMIGILNYLNYAIIGNITNIPKTASEATKIDYKFKVVEY